MNKMESPPPVARWERWVIGACLSCCLALLLGLAAITFGLSRWVQGGLGLAALVLLGAGGGLIVAHLILDHDSAPRRPRR